MKLRLAVVMPGHHYTVDDLCKALSRRFQVFLILPADDESSIPKSNLYTTIKLAAYHVRPDLPLMPSLARTLRHLSIDAIISGEDFQPNSVYLSILSKLKRIPLLILNEKYFLSRWPLLAPFHKLMLNFIVKPIVWRTACGIICHSTETYRFCQSQGAQPGKFRVIQMGINSRLHSNRTSTSGSDVLRIISVGRLIPLKGFHVILRAAQHLAEKEIRFHLTIVGDGELYHNLQEEIDRRSLRDCVSIIRSMPRDALLRYYDEFDVYIQSSIVEVLGLAALEALSSGLAMIVSDVGGLKDSVEEGVNGYRVPPSDYSRMAEALTLLASDNQLLSAMKKHSLELANRRFAWDVLIDRYAELVIRCHGRNRNG